MYYHQLKIVLQDPDIVERVKKAQLWLVLVEDLLPSFTCSTPGEKSGVEGNFIDPAEPGTAAVKATRSWQMHTAYWQAADRMHGSSQSTWTST